ncbi:hypothetical protein TNCV_1176401 [Trichonephila clavipes]|nr:hypothetical protein TNCV_1176401 [Trichonephila clavipes]
MLPLRNEFTRRFSVHLTTIDQIMMHKMNEGHMILFSLNCQSLRAYARDLPGNIVQKAHILMLSEAWFRNEELIELEHFKHITQYRRPGINRGGRVAIYQNVCGSQHKFIGNPDDFVAWHHLIHGLVPVRGPGVTDHCLRQPGKYRWRSVWRFGIVSVMKKLPNGINREEKSLIFE